ncbi:hypothetical protein GCM10009424_21130 [Sphingomonas ursincola]
MGKPVFGIHCHGTKFEAVELVPTAPYALLPKYNRPWITDEHSDCHQHHQRAKQDEQEYSTDGIQGAHLRRIGCNEPGSRPHLRHNVDPTRGDLRH